MVCYACNWRWRLCNWLILTSSQTNFCCIFMDSLCLARVTAASELDLRLVIASLSRRQTTIQLHTNLSQENFHRGQHTRVGGCGACASYRRRRKLSRHLWLCINWFLFHFPVFKLISESDLAICCTMHICQWPRKTMVNAQDWILFNYWCSPV